MSLMELERAPGLYDGPPIDMPPMDVIKCQCSISCIGSGPCELEANDDDLLCELCRAAKKCLEAMGKITMDTALGQLYLRRSMTHCHRCDIEFNQEGDSNGDRSGSA